MDSNSSDGLFTVVKSESNAFSTIKVSLDSYHYIIKENRKNIRESLLMYFDSFVDNYIGIQSNDVFNRCKQLVDDMYNNPDCRYFDFFCKSLFGKMPFSCCNFEVEDYLKRLKNGKTNNYFFVLYSGLYGYSLNKENYDKFENVLSDIPFMMLYDERWNNHFDSYDDFSSRVFLIENIISYKNYLNNLGLRKFLKDVLWLWNSSVLNSLELAHRVIDLEEFFDIVSYIGEDGIDSNIDLILSDIVNGKSPFALYPIFYYGNRYEYLSSLEVEDSDDLKKDILMNITELNFDLFDDLNRESEKDSFISCMDVVFDSDSYTELFSKLALLKQVSHLYLDDKKVEEALLLLKKLNDESHKKEFCGRKVSYPNTMNKIVKPKRIIDRMKYLYSQIDSSLLYDFMDEFHESAENVQELCESVDAFVEKEMLPKNRLKRKVMSFFKERVVSRNNR